MKIFFYIEETDKSKYIGLSISLKKSYPDFINKCSRFCINDATKYAINISIKSQLNQETFNNITKDIINHFKKDLLIYYKNGDETGDYKYTFSNIKPKIINKEPKKYTFIPDE